MKHTHFSISMAILAGAIAAGFSCGARAQVTSNDDFTLGHDPNSWVTFDGACLTAGDGSGSIPPCVGLPYYNNQVQIGGQNGWLGNTTAPGSGAGQTPDAVGQGALRFTNWYTQAGSIISSGTPFATGAGLQVVFKTISYDGDSRGAGGDGADGMGFFLMDGAYPPYDTGAFGGSLGYTCSNVNNDANLRADGTPRQYDGLAHAYLGLGIDEYGNFLNQGDNTASGFGYLPGRIGLRGAGSISWGALSALSASGLNPNMAGFYPATLTLAQQASAVQNTCRTGFYWNYSNPATPSQSAFPAPDYAPVGAPVILSAIPQLAGNNIANEGAQTRGAAQPITYNLKITQDGLLSLAISYNGGSYIPVITKQSITASNGALPASFRFGFTGSTGGARNVHEILCFQAAPSDVAGTSVGVNEQEATKIASGTQAYLAYYYPQDSTGRLTANNLVYSAATQTIGISAVSNWDASCNLTGIVATQTCVATGVTGPLAPQINWNNRVMLTWDPTIPQGVAFRWFMEVAGSSINTTQENILDAGDTAPINNSRLHYLRGDRSNEISPLGVGLYRARDSVLGDIVDSSPTWVGPPTSHYAITWNDQLIPTDPMPENTGTQSFAQYIAAEQTRLNVVYTGANDGFLHGFRSGSFDVNGNYVSTGATPNDGQEVLAYMPNAVLNTIHNATNGTLDFAGSQYSHNFFVDATPDTDDVFYSGAWHTWLVGGLGAGGAAIYALDITNPTNFAESAAATLVMGEWSSTSIGCNPSNVANCGVNMGNTYGTPIVRRLHDGMWAIIFGNGFGSASGDAGIFVMLIDANGNTQAANTYYLSTGTGTGTLATPCASNCNGIAYVSSADLDGDHITDYVYAGDLLGNVWRFDLTSATELNWAASSTPLFTAAAGQPITTKLQVVSVPQATGVARIMIEFGTGQKFPFTALVPTTYQTGTQSLYGIWDWNMTNWNSKSGTQYLSLPAGATLTPANLTTQTLTQTGSVVAGTAALTVTSNVVCWSGSATCAGGPGSNSAFGWTVALPGVQEQIVYNPLIYQNALIVNTTIPAVNSPTSCTVSHDTGNTIAISLINGGALGNASGSFFINSTVTNAAGSQTNGTGTPFVAQAGGLTFILTQSLGGASFSYAAGSAPPSNAPFSTVTGSNIAGGGIHGAAIVSKRLTWIERR
jgi:type IV pilus assembly protein PilY1